MRPTGVTVIAILDFIACGLQALFAIGAFVGGSMIGAFVGALAGKEGSGAMGAGVGMFIGAVLGVVFLIMSVVSGVLGWGMWGLKEWARIVQMVFAVMSAIFQLLGLLGSLARFRPLGMMWNLIWLAYSAWVVYYLIQPHVKAAFARPITPAYAPPAAPPMA